MEQEWVIMHGGALGDLALTLQLALQLQPGALHVVSRVDLGDLNAVCEPDQYPTVAWYSSESLQTHRLFSNDDQPNDALRQLIRSRRVLNTLHTGNGITEKLIAAGARDVYSFDPRPLPNDDRHITRQWQDQLESAGLTFLEPTVQRVNRPSERCQKVLIHPGSGGKAKCWHLAGFLAVADALVKKGIDVQFLVGPVERECWAEADLLAIEQRFPITASQTPDALLSALRNADVFLGNDSGPSHLASLVGTRTVTLFGPTPASVWHPLGVDARVIVGDNIDAADWGISAQQVLCSILSTEGKRFGQ